MEMVFVHRHCPIDPIRVHGVWCGKLCVVENWPSISVKARRACSQ